MKRYLLNREVAFWGHGQNLQSASPSGLRIIWKRWLKSDNWWFDPIFFGVCEVNPIKSSWQVTGYK
ncbi:MAG: hypothetical protein ACJAW1_003569 [Glaciecola sp.]